MFQQLGTHRTYLVGLKVIARTVIYFERMLGHGRYYVTCCLLKKTKHCGNLSTFIDILATPDSRIHSL